MGKGKVRGKCDFSLFGLSENGKKKIRWMELSTWGHHENGNERKSTRIPPLFHHSTFNNKGIIVLYSLSFHFPSSTKQANTHFENTNIFYTLNISISPPP